MAKKNNWNVFRLCSCDSAWCGSLCLYYLPTKYSDFGKKLIKKIGEETKVIEATEPLTILLMGVDTGNVERTDPWAGNSDSMILVTVNPKTKKVVMMSLERDIP